jgi:putative DNA primase/helicase
MKDLSELHLQNEAGFKTILAGLLESALAALEADHTTPDVQPEPLSDDTSILIAELAKLTPIEYDQQRETAAGKLGIRVATLDQEVKQARLANQPQATTTNGTAIFMEEVELWPEPVDGVELLNDLTATFKRHVALPDFADVLMALWVVFTYAIDAAFTAPILAITSPQKRCGKTTLLALLTQLVHKALSASNITAAALFRSIEKWMPTLLVDEADTFLKDKEELRGVINAGHTRSTAYVIRTVGDDHEPTQFNVWGAKAIAMIGALPDTIADRSINVTMRRRRADEKIEKLRVDRTGEFSDLARRCARWSSDNMGRLKAADPSVPDSLHDRAADNWRPLLAIADAVGGKWPELARNAATAMSGSESQDDDSAGVMLLTDMQTIFKEDGAHHIASAELVKKLVEIEERPWPEWYHQKPITPRQVARLLKPFKITPATIRIGHRTAKGYSHADLKDAFARYISLSSVTGVTSLNNNEIENNLSVTLKPDVTDKNGDNSFNINGVTDVTDKKGVFGDAAGNDGMEVFEP